MLYPRFSFPLEDRLPSTKLLLWIVWIFVIATIGFRDFRFEFEILNSLVLGFYCLLPVVAGLIYHRHMRSTTAKFFYPAVYFLSALSLILMPFIVLYGPNILYILKEMSICNQEITALPLGDTSQSFELRKVTMGWGKPKNIGIELSYIRTYWKMLRQKKVVCTVFPAEAGKIFLSKDSKTLFLQTQPSLTSDFWVNQVFPTDWSRIESEPVFGYLR